MHPKILKRRMEVAQDRTDMLDELISQTLKRLIFIFEQYSDVINGSRELIHLVQVLSDQLSQSDSCTNRGQQIRSQICTFFGASSQDLTIIATKLASIAEKLRDESSNNYKQNQKR